ncbi:MAG TPA: hypothetical protein VK420_00405 [Longimicrobium sp.]|jgi:hypothetical protein|nr:hypothetical protein [Longimicrobium sp.]
MWTTRDGYTLELPHDSLHTILSRLRPEQLRGITGGPLSGDPGPRLAQAVGRVAQAARRTPETLGGALPVFSAPGFRLLVRPRGPTQGEILMVRPEGEADSELHPVGSAGATRPFGSGAARRNLRVRGARVTIAWKMLPVAHAKSLGVRDANATVYILAKRTPVQEPGNKSAPESQTGPYLRPLYVGETRTQSRIVPRMDVLRAFDVDTSPYVVCVGTIRVDPPGQQQVQTPAGPRAFNGSAADWQLLREDVEHVLVRILMNAGYRLTVLSPSLRLWVAELGISIKHENPPAFLDPRGLTLTRTNQPTPFEIAPLGWG